MIVKSLYFKLPHYPISAKEDLKIFSNDEVRMFLSDSGFESIKIFGNYDLATHISDDTKVVAFLSCKTNQ